MTHEAAMRWAIGIAIAAGIWIVGWLTRRFALSWLARFVRRTPNDLDDFLLDALRPHVPLWFLLLESSINFTVILRVKQFVDRYLVAHEFVKRLQRRYLEVGIEIPFPQRVVHLPRGEGRR